MSGIAVPRKVFEVVIENRTYDVYNIEGKEHDGPNGEIKTWWLYYGGQLSKASGEVLIPPIDSPHWKPWHVSIERLNWDISFKQITTTKYKWDHLNFRSHTTCEMRCNGKLVYEFGTTGGSRGMSFAMAKAQYLETILCEHPFDFLNPDRMQGRKICWYGLPATVRVRNGERKWEIDIIPDYSDALNQEEWWAMLKSRKANFTAPDPDHDPLEAEYEADTLRDGYIRWGDALSDQHIYWFRK
jgi:hypothetical protein